MATDSPDWARLMTLVGQMTTLRARIEGMLEADERQQKSLGELTRHQIVRFVRDAVEQIQIAAVSGSEEAEVGLVEELLLRLHGLNEQLLSSAEMSADSVTSFLHSQEMWLRARVEDIGENRESIHSTGLQVSLPPKARFWSRSQKQRGTRKRRTSKQSADTERAAAGDKQKADSDTYISGLGEEGEPPFPADAAQDAGALVSEQDTEDGQQDV